MTLYDYLEESDFEDIDIVDNTYDGLYVAFCLDPELGDDGDSYDQLLVKIAKGLDVIKYYSDYVIVDATKWVLDNKTVLDDIFDLTYNAKNDEDAVEYYVDTVLPGIISGYVTDSVYNELNNKIK